MTKSMFIATQPQFQIDCNILHDIQPAPTLGIFQGVVHMVGAAKLFS